MENALHFIFINGKGSSGKDTQADRLISTFGEESVKISTGEIFRGAMAKSGEYAKYFERLAPYAKGVDVGGKLISDDVIVEIVREVVTHYLLEGKRFFVFTGFPRTDPQLVETDKMLRELESRYSLSVNHIYYEVSDEVSRKRVEGRRLVDIKKGNAPRKDDLEEVVEGRLEEFRLLTMPMINRLEMEGRLIRIDGSPAVGKIARETQTKLMGKERL